MSILLIINRIMDFALGIIILVYYLINFKEVNHYAKYGACMMAVIALLQLPTLEMNSLLVLTIISVIKIGIYTCMGMHICSSIESKDLPLLRKLFKEADNEDIDWKRYVFYTAAVIVLSVIFSYILFKTTSPTASEAIKKSLENQNTTVEIVKTLNVRVIFMILPIVIAEEILFRFVLPNFLIKQFSLTGNRYWFAIIFSSILWTLAHANTLNPEWVKFAQIFPLGLALGALFRKFGLESCIFAHIGFNVIMLLISSSLIRI